mmetsp:Transcript_8083/g.25686  ORF Transcript_8083/g.25686 Transcript_8083/m.25686 type:complete len:372 (+) Transcript_8083:216-1331(+)
MARTGSPLGLGVLRTAGEVDPVGLGFGEDPGVPVSALVGLHRQRGAAVEVLPQEVGVVVVLRIPGVQLNLVLEEEPAAEGRQPLLQLRNVALLGVGEDEPRGVLRAALDGLEDGLGVRAILVPSEPVAAPDVDGRVDLRNLVLAQEPIGIVQKQRGQGHVVVVRGHDGDVLDRLGKKIHNVHALRVAIKDVRPLLPAHALSVDALAPLEVHQLVEGVAGVRAEVEVPAPRVGEVQRVHPVKPELGAARAPSYVHRGVVVLTDHHEGADVERQAVGHTVRVVHPQVLDVPANGLHRRARRDLQALLDLRGPPGLHPEPVGGGAAEPEEEQQGRPAWPRPHSGPRGHGVSVGGLHGSGPGALAGAAALEPAYA